MIRLTAVSDADLTEIYTCDLQVLASCGANHTENAAQIVDIISANFLVLQEHRATTLTYLGVLLMLRDGQTISARRFAVVVRAMLVAVAISAVGFGVVPLPLRTGRTATAPRRTKTDDGTSRRVTPTTGRLATATTTASPANHDCASARWRGSRNARAVLRTVMDVSEK